jgi:dipeptidyl aminopeptidase/acylaminoacyl peptidase
VKKTMVVAAMLGIAAVLSAPLAAQAPAKRPFTPADVARLHDVNDPVVSPDGAWVVYLVTSADTAADRRQSDIWMTSWDGNRTIQLTHTAKESEHSPRWSPDGRFLSFLSGRGDEHEADQVWLLDRSGGEAERVSELKGSVDDYVWSPDSKRLALVIQDVDPQDTIPAADSATKRVKPIVLDRYQFKRDYAGYLTDRYRHLWLFDLATRKAEQLTSGKQDEELPSWSPDGKSIAFSSKRTADPDRTDDWNIFRIDATPGAQPKRLTTSDLNDGDPSWGSRPAWSPDGKSIAYLQGGPDKLIYYGLQNVAVVPADGGVARVLTSALDKWTRLPQWSADGSSLYFLVEEDRSYHLAKVPAAGGAVESVVTGKRVLSGLDVGPGGKLVVVSSTPDAPQEVFAIEGRELRPLSRQNADLLREVAFASAEEISFKSKDGTLIGGFIMKPRDYQPGRRYPTVLRIHGGPVGQFQNDFDTEWQILAAHGYAVVAANPRGSSGRGQKFTLAIYADWGNKDVQDVLAAVDHAVAAGIADPARLGVGGWSYGGILTNYTIASDRRFKAATSGAGISNILAGYGTDQYVREYDAELGQPSKATATWIKLSYPFLHADRITTPTLFLCGQKDFNVPLINSEQMYQSLKSLGRDTELIIYPGEFHGIRRPSFVRDRFERYVAWYDKHLSAGGGATAAGR